MKSILDPTATSERKPFFPGFSRVLLKPYKDLTNLDKVNVFLWAIESPEEIDRSTVELVRRVKSDKVIRGLRLSSALQDSALVEPWL